MEAVRRRYFSYCYDFFFFLPGVQVKLCLLMIPHWYEYWASSYCNPLLYMRTSPWHIAVGRYFETFRHIATLSCKWMDFVIIVEKLSWFGKCRHDRSKNALRCERIFWSTCIFLYYFQLLCKQWWLFLDSVTLLSGNCHEYERFPIFFFAHCLNSDFLS